MSEEQQGNTPTLRSIPPAAQYFWRASIQEQLSLVVEDVDPDGKARKLPKNELLCMALNEVAARHRCGFFLYLPSRECWKTPANGNLLPESRRTPPPGARYPSLMYMELAWSEGQEKSFVAEQQRGRYLKCNALLNPPASCTPLYAIQVADHARAITYQTPEPTLIIFQTPATLYLIDTKAATDMIGAWSKAWRPSGPEPDNRLNTAPFLWSSDSAHAQQKRADMQHLQHSSLSSLYQEILRRCAPDAPGGLLASFTAAECRLHIIPRPSSPGRGIALGEPESNTPVEQSADPPSRRGVPRKRQKRGVVLEDTGGAREDGSDGDGRRGSADVVVSDAS
ncbi:hypothetical protein LTR12_010991 [Friedmanniomyces endolithicus]|nr:hypothetical protein LTR12_010991 [Friedmanniomyces endolithicus]